MANEYVTSFLDLRVFQNEDEAEKELKADIYSDALIGIAKNLLESCDENAILFTGGDNDTYPLLYVQSELGFRQDVLVVNLSLLNTSRYINHLRKPILTAEAAPFSISNDQIEGDLRSFLYVANNMSDEMEVSDALAFVLDDDNSLVDNNETPLFELPTNRLKITTDNGVIAFVYKEPYLYRSGLMVLDILAKNQMDRPIYFSNGNASSSFMGLNPYLSYVGLAIKLGTTANTSQGSESLLHVNTTKLYDNLMSTYDFSGLDDINKQDERVLIGYSRLFHQLAEVLIEQGEKEKAQNVLNRWLDVMPSKRDYMDIFIPVLIADFYGAGLTDQANKLMDDFKTDLPSLLDEVTREKLEEEKIELIRSQLEDIKVHFG